MFCFTVPSNCQKSLLLPQELASCEVRSLYFSRTLFALTSDLRCTCVGLHVRIPVIPQSYDGKQTVLASRLTQDDWDHSHSFLSDSTDAMRAKAVARAWARIDRAKTTVTMELPPTENPHARLYTSVGFGISSAAVMASLRLASFRKWRLASVSSCPAHLSASLFRMQSWQLLLQASMRHLQVSGASALLQWPWLLFLSHYWHRGKPLELLQRRLSWH